MDDIVQEFLVESYENLDQLDHDLVALERDPSSRELLSSIFRTVHTIKGTSGFLGYGNLERVSHSGENLLAELRDGARQMDPPTTDVLLALVDTLRATLGVIEAGRGDDYDVDPAVARITALADGAAQQAPAAAGPDLAELTISPEPTVPPELTVSTEAVVPVEVPVSAGTVSSGVQAAAAIPTEPGVERPPAATAPVAKVIGRRSAAHQPPAASPAPIAESPAPKPPTPAPEPVLEAPARETDHVRGAAESSIRVDVGLLDTLMRQVGELVLVRNQIDLLADRAQQGELSRSAQRLSLIAGELQEGVMKTRMQPIEQVWSKMPRVVRDLSSLLGRTVSLRMVGGETELDRSLLEAVKDPLTHLVRNAVDHGIEPPAERLAAGKPEQGRVTLRAYHAGGQVVVEIIDDGRGIDAEAVATSAVSKGLRTPEQIQTMSPQEIYGLLFLPGFSTAAKVTNVSGRGVGMDVVRTKIEAIGGSVDVESVRGQGTTWRMRIPLTLAIMPALTVQCRAATFALAQANLLELVAVERSQIEYVGSAPVYRLRGSLLPLVSLAEVLDLGAQQPDSCVIAVLQAEDQRFGLLVDSVLNNEEIVVKAIASRLKQIGIYSGATVLGDGTVALILDVLAVARRALATEAAVAARRAPETAAATTDREQLLVVAVGGERRVAIPITAVTRLERTPASRVERIGSREVLQYRGEVLPLVRLDRHLGELTDPSEELDVIVYSRHGRSAAMVVTGVVDIVDDDGSLRSDIDDAGLLGATVVGDRVTELLDVRAAVSAADREFFADVSLNGTGALTTEMAWS